MEQIKESIAGLSNKVAQNAESITGINGRVVNIEKEFREIHKEWHNWNRDLPI